MCVLLSGFMGSGTTKCQIIYGTDDSYRDLPFMDTGSNTGTIITVPLTATLQPRTTYYYIATATSENVCARQLGSFTTGTCVFSTGCTKVLAVHIGMVNWLYMYTFRVSACVCVWAGEEDFPLCFLPLLKFLSHYFSSDSHKSKDHNNQ